LLELNRTGEAAEVLDKIRDMIGPPGAKLPYGDELNFFGAGQSRSNTEHKISNSVG